MVKKINSLVRIAENDLQEEFMKQVNPTKVKVDIGKKPKWKYSPVKVEYPGKKEKVIDLDKDLAPTVRKYAREVFEKIQKNSERLEELKELIKEREKRAKEKDKVWQKLEEEQKAKVNELFSLIKQAVQVLSQYDAANVQQKIKVKDIESQVQEIQRKITVYLAEVPTGRITTKGLKGALQKLADKFGIVIDELTEQEFMLDAMGKQLHIVFEQLDEVLSAGEGTQHTSSLLITALSWSWIKEKFMAVYDTIKNALKSVIDKGKQLLSSSKKVDTSLDEVEQVLKQVSEELA